MYSIYKIHYKDLCYVGITNNFERRISGHKHMCLNQERKEHNQKVYQVIRANGGWEAWTKEVVETTDDKTKERYWIEQISNLNSNIPTRSRKEYRLDTITERKEYDKKRYNNPEYKKKRSEYHKEWYELNKEQLAEKFTCECGGKYLYCHKSTHFKTLKHLNYINTNVLANGA